ncbi:MAG: TetR/AcrR family transcriptional regulator [Sphingomonadales bacterium]|nr:TetR/AcrR family transcriptional regulator [Sphingomonadales bacterium]
MALSPALREARCRKLVDTAHALIRDTGGTGFSMLELARRAGVSPATPYNLLGSKSEVLRRVVRDEYDSFSLRLADLSNAPPLERLLQAIDLIVVQYSTEPLFYRGLYHSVHDAQASDLRAMMTAEGQILWCEMVRKAALAGELDLLSPAEDFTALLLRTVAATVEAWLAEGWAEDRFSREIFVASRTLILGLIAPDQREQLRTAIKERSAALELGHACAA